MKRFFKYMADFMDIRDCPACRREAIAIYDHIMLIDSDSIR